MSVLAATQGYNTSVVGRIFRLFAPEQLPVIRAALDTVRGRSTREEVEAAACEAVAAISESDEP